MSNETNTNTNTTLNIMDINKKGFIESTFEATASLIERTAQVAASAAAKPLVAWDKRTNAQEYCAYLDNSLKAEMPTLKTHADRAAALKANFEAKMAALNSI